MPLLPGTSDHSSVLAVGGRPYDPYRTIEDPPAQLLRAAAAAWARLAAEVHALRPAVRAFERYCPYGSPEEVAEAVRAYLQVGYTSVDLIATAPTPREAANGAVRVRALLREEV